MGNNYVSQLSGHSVPECVANALSICLYLWNKNSNSIFVPENMSIGTKIDFLLQLLTRQSTRRAQTFLANAHLARRPFFKKKGSSDAKQLEGLAFVTLKT